mgnify:CR=1 FL=1
MNIPKNWRTLSKEEKHKIALTLREVDDNGKIIRWSKKTMRHNDAEGAEKLKNNTKVGE